MDCRVKPGSDRVIGDRLALLVTLP